MSPKGSLGAQPAPGLLASAFIVLFASGEGDSRDFLPSRLYLCGSYLCCKGRACLPTTPHILFFQCSTIGNKFLAATEAVKMEFMSVFVS